MPYKWRIQSVKYGKASCVAYVDARQVMERLDDVFGVDGWSDNYSEHKGNLFCTISVMSESGIEIQKTDCGTESNIEKQKGEASDAFKRAAVKLGIGRFLYDLKIVVLKTAKHTNDKEYPATDEGKILWGADDLSTYIIKNKAPKSGKPASPQETRKPAKPDLIVFKEGTKDLTLEMEIVFSMMKNGTYTTPDQIAETYTISAAAASSIAAGFSKLKKAK